MTKRIPKPIPWERFPLDARLAWMRLSPDRESEILSAVWCEACGNMSSMTVDGGRLEGKMLTLEGRCDRCGASLIRPVQE